jgi:predicted ABC-type ATPase
LTNAKIADYVPKGESFAFETTLSSLSYLARIRQWWELGYPVSTWAKYDRNLLEWGENE